MPFNILPTESHTTVRIRFQRNRMARRSADRKSYRRQRPFLSLLLALFYSALLVADHMRSSSIAMLHLAETWLIIEPGPTFVLTSRAPASSRAVTLKTDDTFRSSVLYLSLSCLFAKLSTPGGRAWTSNKYHEGPLVERVKRSMNEKSEAI